ncbi:MAG TPA: acyl-CoA dehydrogenase family protein, partial [Anaerolineales bacterium]|nr:acyl-CoA dehydrogenase family protein [Anaerolineales bacterium]
MTSGAVDGVIAWLQSFAQRWLADREQIPSITPDLFLELGRNGTLGLQSPKPLGGLNLSAADSIKIMEQLGAIDMSLAACVAVQNFLSGAPIRRYGSSHLKSQLIPDMIAGRRLIAFAMTESQAGSDPRRIKASACRVGPNEWEFSGAKIWSGMAPWADAFCTFGHAYDEKDQGLGTTGFVIESKVKGMFCGPEIQMMGLRGMVRSMVTFDRVRCNDSCILGHVGGGRAIALETMSEMRLYMAALALGAAKRALQLSLRHVKTRNVATGPMRSNPVVLEAIDISVSRILAIQALVNFSADALDAQTQNANELLLASKIIASEWAGSVVDTALQMAGGRGYMEQNTIARIFRDIRAFRIIEGPTEALASHLGGMFLLNLDQFESLPLFHDEANIMRPTLEILATAARRPNAVGSSELARKARLHARHQLGHLIAITLVAAAAAQQAKLSNDKSLDRAADFTRGKLTRFMQNIKS